MHKVIQEHPNQKCWCVTEFNVQTLETKTIYNQDLTHKCTLQKPARMRFCAYKYSKDLKKSEENKQYLVQVWIWNLSIACKHKAYAKIFTHFIYGQ